MATLLSIGTGNFTTAGTWGTVDATSLSDSQAANTTLTTSYQTSSTFTPGAITISGIAIQIATRQGSTGTITIALDLATVDVPGTVVTINVADIAAITTAGDARWYMFKFAAPVLLVGATVYGVKAKTSSSSQVNLYSTSSANWSRALVTTTTAAPAASNDLIITGDYTAAGAGSSYTVTMDNTATTSFGALSICSKGTLSYGVAASTNYYLKLGGNMTVFNGGAFAVSTSGSPLDSTSTAVLEMNVGSDGQYKVTVKNAGSFKMYGAVVTTTKTTLTSDAAAAAISLVMGSTAGMAAAGVGVLASTTRTTGDAETVTITTVTNGTTLAVPAIAVAHLGTSPRQAEFIYLTRNVKFRGMGTTLGTALTTGNGATLVLSYVECRYGTLHSSNPGGMLELFTTSAGSCDVQYCSIYDCVNGAAVVGNTAVAVTYDNITFSNNVMYNNCINPSTSILGVKVGFNGLPGSSVLVQNNTIVKNAGGLSSNSGNFQLSTFALEGATITGNVVTSCTGVTAGLAFAIADTSSNSVKSFSGNSAHSNGSFGMQITGIGVAGKSYTLGSFTYWRNGNNGFSWGQTSGFPGRVTFDTWTGFENANNNINYLSSTDFGQHIWLSPTMNSGASLTSISGLNFAGGGSGDIFIKDGSFGATTGHSTADIVFGSAFANFKVYLFNTALASTTEVSMSSSGLMACVRSNQHDASSTTFKLVSRAGTITADTATRHTASGYSWKMTPALAAMKLVLPGPSQFDTFKRAAVANVAVTVTLYFQKDGSYNGAAARLVVIGGVTPGIATDQTASMSVASGNWEQLTVTVTPTADGVIEFYADCDGTAGNIYVDDAAVAQVGLPVTTTLDIPGRGAPADSIYGAGGGLLVHPGMVGGMRG